LVNKIKEDLAPILTTVAVPVELIASTLTIDTIGKKVGRKDRPTPAAEYSTIKRTAGIYTRN
jgi:hypothetical protein